MARPKKNGTYLNVCIETPIYERLEALCNDAGQTKTVAVERAINLSIGILFSFWNNIYNTIPMHCIRKYTKKKKPAYFAHPSKPNI